MDNTTQTDKRVSDDAADALRNVCAWIDDGEGHFDTSCGNRHTLIDGTPKDNHMKFCCYCGRHITALDD
jgi:hypothetical protein